MSTQPPSSAYTPASSTPCSITASVFSLSFPYELVTETATVVPHIIQLPNGMNSTSLVIDIEDTTFVQNPVAAQYDESMEPVWTIGGVVLTSGTTYVKYANFTGGPGDTTIELPATTDPYSLILPAPGNSVATLATQSAIFSYLDSLTTVVDQLDGHAPASCAQVVIDHNAGAGNDMPVTVPDLNKQTATSLTKTTANPIFSPYTGQSSLDNFASNGTGGVQSSTVIHTDTEGPSPPPTRITPDRSGGWPNATTGIGGYIMGGLDPAVTTTATVTVTDHELTGSVTVTEHQIAGTLMAMTVSTGAALREQGTDIAVKGLLAFVLPFAL